MALKTANAICFHAEHDLIVLAYIFPDWLVNFDSMRIVIDTYRPWTHWPQAISIANMARKPDILEEFGKRVRKLRLESGWSQEKFAHQCELDRTYVGGVERGERNIALKNIKKMADALGVSLAELLNGI